MINIKKCENLPPITSPSTDFNQIKSALFFCLAASRIPEFLSNLNVRNLRLNSWNISFVIL